MGDAADAIGRRVVLSSWYEINGLIELIADFLAVTDASIDRLEQLLREEPHG